MKTESIFFINYRKLTKRRKKALFLIIPLSFLVAMAVLVSSQVANFQQAADASIFGTIDEQNKAIYLDKTAEQGFARPGSFFNSEDSQFYEADIESVEDIDHVEIAALNQVLPVSNIVTTDLFAGIEVSLNSVVGLDSNIASLYTDQDFEYQEGGAIPIILNASSFVESYEDWGGQDSITITMRRGTRGQPGEDGSDPQEEMQNQLPFKTRSIDYNKEDLIGQEFTMRVGGLDELETYGMTFTTSGQMISKLSESDIAQAEQDRDDFLAAYWDIDQLSTPQIYVFKIVGIVNDNSNFNTYIPTDFAKVMVSDYIENQLAARNDVEISTDDLNATFVGLTYDGLELSSATGSGFGIMAGHGKSMGGMRPGEGATSGEDTENYNIPGLVVEINRDDDSVIGEYLNTDVFSEAVQSSGSAVVVIDDVENRDVVVASINELGYSLTDKNDLEVFEQIESTLNGVSWGLSVSIVLLAALLISFTMGKFVSDSRKEIGIFRALGMTKKSVRNLFIHQTALYAGIAYVIGALLGIVLIFVTATGAKSWFESFLAGTMEKTFSVVTPVATSAFFHIDWLSFFLYSVLILLVSILISLIPASKAARIDPVQAIKEE